MTLFQLILLLFIIILVNNQNQTSNQAQDKVKEEADNLMKQFLDEWEEKMQDYKMEYLYYIPIQPRDQEIYFENVTTVPTTFKGSFFLSDESVDKIEFYIKDSYDKVIYKATGHHNIFEIPINRPDKYTLTFRNNLSKNKVVVTFTMNTGQNNILNSKDLTNTEKKMDNLEGVIKKFNMEFKLSRDIHTRRYKSKYNYIYLFKIISIIFFDIEINKTNNYFYIFAFVETFILIAISIWQSYYMKHLFEVKGSL